MTISELKAILERYEAEHGDLEIVTTGISSNFELSNPFNRLDRESIALGWIDDQESCLQFQPSNPITDKTVLVID